MMILRIFNVIVWATLFAYMLPGAFQAASGKGVRKGDPMRLSVASVCVVMVLGNLRWLFAPDNETMLTGVTILSLIVGCFKIALANAYGRGPKL